MQKSMQQNTVYLALGTNLGNKSENINNAIKHINKRIGKVEQVSKIIETEPWGFDSCNSFLNAVLRCKTTLTPKELLLKTQEIEKLMGRTTKSTNKEYHDRLIDIDILLFNRTKTDIENLQIPHPLMLERSFVIEPLKDVMPDNEYQEVLNGTFAL